MIKQDFCQCKQPTKVYTDFNDWYELDICCDCGKIIEDSYRELDHYDGEDHVNY